MATKAGTEYYREKGKSSISIRVNSKCVKWLKLQSAETSKPVYMVVEDILSSYDLSKGVSGKASEGTWMTYIDSSLHKKLKVASINLSINLKDLAGMILSESYGKKKRS